MFGERLQGKKESIASVHLALESGIDHLDVAPMYGKGEAERVVGEAIKERSRDSFRLTTKCALGSLPDEEVYDRFNTSLIRSLDTMGTDYVDLFLLHSQLIENDHESQKPDSSFVATGNLTTLKSFYDAVVPAMETLKKEGKILNWGIGPGLYLRCVRCDQFILKGCNSVWSKCFEFIGSNRVRQHKAKSKIGSRRKQEKRHSHFGYSSCSSWSDLKNGSRASSKRV